VNIKPITSTPRAENTIDALISQTTQESGQPTVEEKIAEEAESKMLPEESTGQRRSEEEYEKKWQDLVKSIKKSEETKAPKRKKLNLKSPKKK